jgi:flagellar biogenesis protein FliO
MKLPSRPFVTAALTGLASSLIGLPLSAQSPNRVVSQGSSYSAVVQPKPVEQQPTRGSWEIRNQAAVRRPNEFAAGQSRSPVVLAGAESSLSRAAGNTPPTVVSTNNSLRERTNNQIDEPAERIPLSRADQSEVDASTGRSSSVFQTILSVGSSLLIVVGLFLGVAWCYRKSLSSSLAVTLPKHVVNVLGRTPLAARQQLVLVRFGSKLVLVSMVQGEARTISEITDPIEVDRLAGLCESGQPSSITQSFRSVLARGDAP